MNNNDPIKTMQESMKKWMGFLSLMMSIALAIFVGIDLYQTETLTADGIGPVCVLAIMGVGFLTLDKIRSIEKRLRTLEQTR